MKCPSAGVWRPRTGAAFCVGPLPATHGVNVMVHSLDEELVKRHYESCSPAQQEAIRERAAAQREYEGRICRHEAAHVVAAILVGLRVRYVSPGAGLGGEIQVSHSGDRMSLLTYVAVPFCERFPDCDFAQLPQPDQSAEFGRDLKEIRELLAEEAKARSVPPEELFRTVRDNVTEVLREPRFPSARSRVAELCRRQFGDRIDGDAIHAAFEDVGNGA